MKTMKLSFLMMLIALCVCAPNTSAAKKVSATEILNQIAAGETVDYENIKIYGDLDLSKLPYHTNDATYPENGKTTRVYSARIKQPVIFRNVVFTGKVDFFRKVEFKDENREYRVIFSENVIFENCRFNQKADFELTNFDSAVSFAGSIFSGRPSFVRVGISKAPDFAGTTFKRGSEFRNFQNDKTQNLTAAALGNFYENYLKASE